VIVGPDRVYRPMDGGWVGQRDQSHDRVVRRGVTQAGFTRCDKSTYRCQRRDSLGQAMRL